MEVDRGRGEGGGPGRISPEQVPGEVVIRDEALTALTTEQPLTRDEHLLGGRLSERAREVRN